MSSNSLNAIDSEKRLRLEQLLDRQEILDCLLRFCRGMDRFDRELFLSAFHSDAIIAAGEFVAGQGNLLPGLHDCMNRANPRRTITC